MSKQIEDYKDMLDKSQIAEVNGYSPVSRYIMDDAGLSLKAKGLLCLLYCLPESFKPNVKGLCFFTSDGEKAVSNGIKELKEKKYLTVEPIRGDDGKIQEWKYTPYMHPYDISDEEAAKPKFIDLDSEDGESNVRIQEMPVCIQYHYYILTDKTLSLTAKGLLAYMFSRSAKWHFSERGLAARNADGRKSVSTAIHELIDKKYLYTDQSIGPDGKKGHMIYTFGIKPFEMEEEPECQNPATVIQATDNPSAKNGRLEDGWQKNGRLENEGLTNNNITKSKTTNSKEINCSVIKSSSSTEKNKKDLEANRYFKEEAKKMIKEELNYKWLVKRSYKAWEDVENEVLTDRDEIDKLIIREDILDKIVDFIADLYAYPEREYTISGETYSAEDLKERYQSEVYNLKSWTVKNWVDTLKDKSIKNKRSYFYSMLVNC